MERIPETLFRAIGSGLLVSLAVGIVHAPGRSAERPLLPGPRHTGSRVGHAFAKRINTVPFRGLGALPINTAGNREDAVNYMINGITLNDQLFSASSSNPRSASFRSLRLKTRPSVRYTAKTRAPLSTWRHAQAPTNSMANCSSSYATMRSMPVTFLP